MVLTQGYSNHCFHMNSGGIESGEIRVLLLDQHDTFGAALDDAFYTRFLHMGMEFALCPIYHHFIWDIV